MGKRSLITASLYYEQDYLAKGCQHIFGLDEAGRGAWAGPVVVGAVCLPVADPQLRQLLVGVRDSKQTTRRQRETLAQRIKDVAITWGIGSASNQEIDAAHINAATELAMQRALADALGKVEFSAPDALLLDSVKWPEMNHIPQKNLNHGDTLSLSIAAASILAKTARDAMMRDLDRQYPDYGFAQHKGYGTAKHRAALHRLRASAIHRRYYRPVQQELPLDGE